MQRRVQCRCGKTLALPSMGTAIRFRCPACGTRLLVRPAPGAAATTSSRAGQQPRSAGERSESEPVTAQYELVPDPPVLPLVVAPASPPSGETFVPAAGAVPATAGRTKRHTALPSPPDDLEEAAVEFPGPFFALSTFFYPWLYPTWAYWLGLMLMAELTVLAIAAAYYFLAVIMAIGAFMALFAFGSMMVACVGLCSYLAATFCVVIEGTANGDDRLTRLPGLVWYEILPAFMRTSGAALSAAALAWGLTYPFREHLGPWWDPQVVLLRGLLLFLFFPVMMISNSVDLTWLPVYNLLPTLWRLLKRAGYFGVFLLMSLMTWAVAEIAVSLAFYVHMALGFAVAGPALATWLLYYGHWLGRLCRQLSAAE